MIERGESCDTFVVFPPLTRDNLVVFGKNSDRPSGEVQEIVCQPARKNCSGKLKCTYIEIDEAPETYQVILSKPSWMWGAEMGANEHGVCIGNEAVWTKVDIDQTERLLGMDMVRLGLERGKTAAEALDVLIYLLETYGQGGPCSDIIPNFTYHNSFMIVDSSEAWVLETAGQLWAAEKVTDGYRHISNCLSIGTKIDRRCENLEEKAKELGLWDGEGVFSFQKVMEDRDSDTSRVKWGWKLLDRLTDKGLFDVSSMFNLLRDENSGICMADGTTGSQVSLLEPSGSSRPACHWFTGTPDPQNSIFKPFIFMSHSVVPDAVMSPQFEETKDPAKMKPRFLRKVDRSHHLYKLNLKVFDRPLLKVSHVQDKQKEIEDKFVAKAFSYLSNEMANMDGAGFLFKEAVEEEVDVYERELEKKPK